MIRRLPGALAKVLLVPRGRGLQGRARFGVEIVEHGQEAFPVPAGEHGLPLKLDDLTSGPCQHPDRELRSTDCPRWAATCSRTSFSAEGSRRSSVVSPPVSIAMTPQDHLLKLFDEGVKIVLE